MPAFALPTSDAPNLAPAQPLERAISQAAQDNSIQVDLKWFVNTRKQLEEENALTWRNQALLWEMLYLFIEGKHLLRRGRSGGWRAVALPERTDTPVYGYNLAGFYSDSIAAKWTQSRTGIRWRGVAESDDLLGAARAADTINQYLSDRLYTETFRQTEAKHAQCGKYARYYYYTNDIKVVGRREKVEQQQLNFGAGSWFCPDCGEGGQSDALDVGTGSVAPFGQLDASGDNSANAGATSVAPLVGGGAVDGQGRSSHLPAPGLPVGGFGVANGRPVGGDQEADFSSVANDGRNGLGAVSAGNTIGQAGERDSGGALASSACPVCGLPNVEREQVEPVTVNAVTGYEPVEMGDFACETVSAFELKHDLSMQPHESPYLIRRRRVRVSVLQSKFPFLKIAPSQSDNPQQQAADNLKYSVYGTANYAGLGLRRGENEREPTADFVQVWLDPSMYARNVLSEPFTTLDGQTLPAGTKLAEVFPTGMYQCWIEGVEGCIELRDEHHKDYWVGQVYRPRVMSALGSGIEDIIEANRQYDLIMSIIYTQLRTAALPATLFDQRLLPNGVSAYIGSLQNIPVNLAPFDDTNKRLSDAVHQLMPQPPTQQHFGFATELNNFMQLASRVTDFSGALPGVDNNTATGAQIAQSLSQALFGPQLALKAEMDRRGAEILLGLWRRFVPFERYVAIAGKRGKQDGIWLSGADVANELQAEIVPESFLPQTNLERRQRWQSLLLDLGGLPGLKMAQAEMPQLLEQLTDLYDVDLGAEDYTAISELCRRRLEQMKQALPMVGIWLQGLPPTQMQADPLSGMAVEVPVDPLAEAGQFLLSILQPPIEMEEFGHMAAINWCRDWLTTDEGLDAPQELRAGIKAMLYTHLDGLMAEAQITGAVQAMGMPPVMPEQNADGSGSDKPGDKSNNPNPQTKQMRPGGTGRPSPKPQPQGATV